jgi:hypothetical protein
MRPYYSREYQAVLSREFRERSLWWLRDWPRLREELEDEGRRERGEPVRCRYCSERTATDKWLLHPGSQWFPGFVVWVAGSDRVAVCDECFEQFKNAGSA